MHKAIKKIFKNRMQETASYQKKALFKFLAYPRGHWENRFSLDGSDLPSPPIYLWLLQSLSFLI